MGNTRSTKPLIMNMWGQDHELYLYYMNDGPCLALGLITLEDGFPEPWCDVTVNIPGYPCGMNEAFVKNYSENTGVDKLLEQCGIACPTGEAVINGFVTIPKYRFDPEKIKEYLYE